jgi:hypothetical protein
MVVAATLAFIVKFFQLHIYLGKKNLTMKY